MQNCEAEQIKRPDRYAYGASMPGSSGYWDYRLCYRMSYQERERARATLSWTWQPTTCRLRRVDGAAFSRWLGPRTLLLWGDSLTGQQFYSLVFMLGAAVSSLVDYDHQAPHETTSELRRDDVCGASGVGGEGGALSVATLRDGGRIVKVLGHQEMAGQLKTGAPGGGASAWWAAQWRRADIVVLNLGHHLRNVDGSFDSYYRTVLDALATARAVGKPTAQYVVRTTNVGHHGCDEASRPLPSRDAAWAQLGGWQWTPPRSTPEYFGKPRQGLADKYDWRAPALHESEWIKQSGFAADLRSRFALLNVSFVDQRADGHVGAAMAYHSDPAKRSAGRDCLHYCLPGPSDSWAHALYNLLMNNEKYA